ncbi:MULTISPECIES: NAD(P)/FAD-dependent oxidoreductase [Nitrincola]|uniref:NADH dehydrogenase-like protein n=1 Tax=Nitrincola nitratireducens TaxID=1229521 RepID=W9V054_9GAMM|nr:MULTISPECIES: FAD-dependent oxidoreductase [Nitrincola]EXJ09517.1 NADH dehydrogenase-like protein [Nitrincola nitratireducens]
MSNKKTPPANERRRDLLKLGLGATVAAPLLSLAGNASANAIRTSAHVVISGAGAGGLAMANRLSRSLQGAKITLIDARQEHHYQPGWTLVASGVWDKSKTLSKTAEWIPSGVNWIRAMVTEYDPDNNRVTLNDGQTLTYDYLIVATGVELQYERIEGMDVNLIGQGKGIGSVYAGIDAAAKTNEEIERFIAKGSGKGVFTLSPTPIKCAGAPLKMTFTTLSRLEDAGVRDRFDMHFFTPTDRVFSVDYYNDFVKQRWTEQGLTRHDFHRLTAIDADRKEATFTLQDGSEITQDYDFLHVVPHMAAPKSVRESELIFKEGPFAGNWMEVDRETLQHTRYSNVFGIGDVMGMPFNKTAASVKMQASVLEPNILAHIQGQPLLAKHNGYTSCPMITAVGKAMLVEFGWGGELLPSFSFIDPKEESWAVWIMKDRMLQPAYNAMLVGKV